eukprot:15444901-Alexandrium_andersonii.AAC.1
MIETATPQHSPFPARQASDRWEFLSNFSLEQRLQNIETVARAQTRADCLRVSHAGLNFRDLE